MALLSATGMMPVWLGRQKGLGEAAGAEEVKLLVEGSAGAAQEAKLGPVGSRPTAVVQAEAPETADTLEGTSPA